MSPQIKSRRSFRLAILLLSGSALAGVPLIMAARAENWTGTTSTDWFTATNWDSNTVPTNTDAAALDTITTNPTVIDTAAATAAELVVGGSVAGTTGGLTISNGGSLTAKGAVLAENGPTSTGTVTLQGGSTMTLTDSAQVFEVGYEGIGYLNILSGSTVNAQSTNLGDQHGSFGYAVVDGAGSVWNAAAVAVGVTGTGSLTVINGAALHMTTIIVGEGSGSGSMGVSDSGTLVSASYLVIGANGGSGAVTVENGAIFNTTFDTVVGGPFPNNPGTSGTGVLNIFTGGVVNTGGNGDIGALANYQGTVTVDGPGSNWHIGDALTVGDGGTGALTVSNGGLVGSSGNVEIGNNAGSSGTVTVTDTGSSLNSSSDVHVGVNGTGSLEILAGAIVQNTDGYIGGVVSGNSGTGTVTVDGAGSRWTNSGQFYVGNGSAATGTLTIQNGGLVDDAAAFIGSQGVGLVTVTGAGSVWNNSQNLVVGGAGQGTVLVTVGGALSAGQVGLGQYAGSTGTLTLDSGATLTDTGGLDIGESGNGVLSVKGGATVTVAGALTAVGDSVGSTGSLLIDGAGSNMTVASFILGETGVGTMTISDGGLLTSQDAAVGVALNTVASTATITGAGSQWDLGTNPLTVGDDYQSAGTITVSDGGALTNVSDLGIGETGAGTLLVQTGGTVSTNSLSLGDFPLGTGTITVTGAGSTLTVDQALVVGNLGAGTLLVQTSGTVTTDSLTLGDQAGATGTISVTDAGSSLTVDHALVVGNAGAGTLSVLNGAVVTDLTGSVGGAAGGGGTALVDGVNSSWTSRNDLTVGGAANGQMTLSNGGAETSSDLIIGHDAGVTGTVIVDGNGSLLSSMNGTLVGADGTGILTVRNGGALNANELTAGLDTGATGTVTITGAGSTATVPFGFEIGVAGSASLSVLDSGQLVTDDSVVGGSSGSNGTAFVDGAGSGWTDTGEMIIGADAGALGALTVSNGGQVTVSDVTYIGYFAGAGTITVTGQGSTLAANGGLAAGFGGNGRLIVADGGVVSTPLLAVASETGSTGEVDIGAAFGDPAAAPGILDTPTVIFGDGTGSLNFNHTSAAYTFAPAISGVGTINQIAGVTFLSADNSGFTGPTNITGGALHVNGSLANSAVAVSGGGTLAGNGTVGAVAVASGGIVAPGNSIGTLTVNGNYSAASGSVYQAQLDSAGHSDLLNVTGAATLANGAVLNISKIDAGAYVPGTQYTLLTAAGGVSGTYTLTGDVQQSAFVSQTLNYDAHDVYLKAVKVASFASAGSTPNQKATGGGADGLPTASPLYAALVSLPTFAVAQGAFDQLSGEIHASARTALVEDSRFVREAALDRLQAPNVAQPVVWGLGFGDWGSNDGNGNAAGMNRSTKGFIGGVDVPVYQIWRVGVLGGFSDTDLNVQDRRSAGSSTNYHLGLYGGTDTGPIAIRLGAAYSWHDLQTARTVAFSGFSDQLAARYNGGTTQAFGEVGYKLNAVAVSLEPFANLAYVNLNMDGFKETGGASALSVASNATGTTFTTLGLHAGKQLDFGTSTIFTAQGSLGWRHAFGDTAPVSTNAFAGSAAFAIDGVPLAQNAAAIDAGFDAAVNDHLTLGLSYTGQYAASAHDNGVKGKINWRF